MRLDTLIPSRECPKDAATGAREADGRRELAVALMVGLLAFGWLTLIRNVRMGHPGDLPVMRHSAASAASPEPVGEPHRAQAPGGAARPGI